MTDIFESAAVANGIGRLLQHLTGTLNQDAGQDVLTQQQSAQPVQDTQPAAVASAQSARSAQSATDSGTTDPVPQGTPVTQGYAGDTGGHPGVDLGVPLDTQLLAAQGGTITHVANDDPGGYGQWVEITTADGYKIRYGHLHSAEVQLGQQVKAGEPIGTSGGEAGGPSSGNSTGAHLHFEVDKDGHTVDPTPWLAGGHQIVNANPSEVTVQTPIPINPQDAADTGIGRATSFLAGQGDTGSENQQQFKETTTKTPGKTTGADNDAGAVDSFLGAIRQHESGGDYTIYNQSGLSNASGAYQFLGSTWRGLGGSTASAAEASPAEQDRIARAYALELFKEFHSWRLAAIAWYGGPGIAQQVAAGQNPGSPEGQGSYVAYGDTIQQMMSGGK